MTPSTSRPRRGSHSGRWALAALLALACRAVLAQPAVLNLPSRLAVDAQSNVFVLELATRRVARFNAAGTLTGRFGVSGTAPGQFQSVQDIAIDPAGNVLVLDRLAKSVLRFTNAGSFIDQWQLFPVASTGRLHSIVVDA